MRILQKVFRVYPVPTNENGHSQRCGCRNTGVHHIGLHAKDPAVSAAFDCDILGMQPVGGSGPEYPLGASAFVSSRPDEESHEIALFANPTLAHLAFKVSSPEEFRSVYARVLERNIPIKFAFNHGCPSPFTSTTRIGT